MRESFDFYVWFFLYQLAQAAAGTQGNVEDIVQSNGVALRPLGTIDRKVTFKELLDKGYIPFTVKEFIGEDPVEEGKAWLGTKISAPPTASLWPCPT